LECTQSCDLNVPNLMDHPHFGHRVITSEKCGTFKMHSACIRPIDLMGDTLQIWLVNSGRLQFGYISNVFSLFRPGQIRVPWEGTFKMYPAYTHWAHWSHMLSVLPMYPACAWWVFGSLSPVNSAQVRQERLAAWLPQGHMAQTVRADLSGHLKYS